ncbi:MAG TPA: c-type cytochrome domain-containing protein [Verrucomicrobiae bacterium]|nr:c-type cytochrome domain-containing protein [Verrucomicrobiae bacterium]
MSAPHEPTLRIALIGLWLASSSAAHAQSKLTYNDHILPLVEANCAQCHNPDKRKGDLDLTSYSGLLKGGGSGPIVVAGNPDSSKLWKAITHAEEPNMPPNKPPLPEKELALVRQWITDGLLESAGAKAVPVAKPSADLALKFSPGAKPDGPPPMPGDLPLDPVVHTTRGGPINSLATSPWAPLIAFTGQKQVLLYHAQDATLLGILPFNEGQPWDLKFSRSGKLLLVAGGHAAQSGRALLWNIETGQRVATVGNEYDTILAADLSPDQTKVALGGPDRLVKIYATATGALLHKLKKHTDWVTAVAFSPNGQSLATADRNGGVVFWDPDNGQELVTTAGHKSGVTALSWRIDSKLVASSSEDGTVKLWDGAEVKPAKSWNAHNGGVLCVAYSHDGRLVSTGRDGQVLTWNADGSKLKTCEFSGEPALRCAFTHDDGRVVAADFTGHVALWDAKSGKRVADLDDNPLPLTNRIALAQAALAQLQNATNSSPATDGLESEVQELTARANAAQAEADKAKSDFTAKAKIVASLKEVAAGPNAPADINEQLAQAREVREKARGVNTAAGAALDSASRKLAETKDKLDHLRGARDPKAELARAESELQRLLHAQKADHGGR